MGQWRSFKPVSFSNRGHEAWFYRNQGSVDVCDGKSIIRIPRKVLEDMLGGLKPQPALKRQQRSERS